MVKGNYFMEIMFNGDFFYFRGEVESGFNLVNVKVLFFDLN